MIRLEIEQWHLSSPPSAIEEPPTMGLYLFTLRYFNNIVQSREAPDALTIFAQRAISS
jgi:hypothetical protein